MSNEVGSGAKGAVKHFVPTGGLLQHLDALNSEAKEKGKGEGEREIERKRARERKEKKC